MGVDGVGKTNGLGLLPSHFKKVFFKFVNGLFGETEVPSDGCVGAAGDAVGDEFVYGGTAVVGDHAEEFLFGGASNDENVGAFDVEDGVEWFCAEYADSARLFEGCADFQVVSFDFFEF